MSESSSEGTTGRKTEVTGLRFWAHRPHSHPGKLHLFWAATQRVTTAPPAESNDQAKPSVEVKTVPAQHNNMVDGAQLYRNYCVTCHGVGGKGDGPAAPALRIPQPDLTVMSRNDKGKFPDLKVLHLLENGTDLAAHGSIDMPSWGPIFRSRGPDDVGHMRQVNLPQYLEIDS